MSDLTFGLLFALAGMMTLLFARLFVVSPLWSNRNIDARNMSRFFSLGFIKLGAAHAALGIGGFIGAVVIALLLTWGRSGLIFVEVVLFLSGAVVVSINARLESIGADKTGVFWETQLRRPIGWYLLNDQHPFERAQETETPASASLGSNSIERLWRLACMRGGLEAISGEDDTVKQTPPILSVSKDYIIIDPLGFTPSDFTRIKDRLSATLRRTIYSVEEVENGIKIQFNQNVIPKMLRINSIKDDGFVLGMSANGLIKRAPDTWPHMMIAGTSGSGKSTFMRHLCYLIVKHYPDALIVVVDIKRDDYEMFEAWPNFVRARSAMHLTKLAEALEVERANREAGASSKRTKIFFIIDEYNATMNAGNIETLEHLTMLFRSANGHMIFGSQRATISDTKLTGVIRENLESRVCFRVKSKHDSRTMLSDDLRGYTLPNIPGRCIVYDLKTQNLIETQGVLLSAYDCTKLIHEMRPYCKPHPIAPRLRAIIADINDLRARKKK